MPRNPELEAILQARYELETCEPSQKTERRAKLDALIDAALQKAGAKNRVFLDQAEVTDAIRTGNVAQAASRLAIIAGVRSVLVAWLAGPENTFVSGQRVVADGGFTRV